MPEITPIRTAAVSAKPPEVPVLELLERAETTKRLTVDEWAPIDKALGISTPTGPASVNYDAVRKMVALWGDSTTWIDPPVKEGMRSYFKDAGIIVPDTKPVGMALKHFVTDAVGHDIRQPDVAFNSLLRLSGRASATTLVAVLDAGTDVGNPVLKNKLWTAPSGEPQPAPFQGPVHGWNFVDNNADVKGLEHGSNTFGIATRGTDRVKGIAIKIVANMSRDPGFGQRVSDGIDYAARNGARAINMSFGLTDPTDVDLLKKAIARYPDILFAMAAGNLGKNVNEHLPGSFDFTFQAPNLARVAAVDGDGKLQRLSDFGVPAITHAAASDFVSAGNDGQMVFMGATSQASPNFLDIAAKCLVLDPGLTPVALNGILADSSTKSEYWRDLVASGGVVNEEAALQVAALTGLISDGLSSERASEKLELPSRDAASVIALAEKYLHT